MNYRNRQYPAYRIPVRAENRRNPYPTRFGNFAVEEIEPAEPVSRPKQTVTREPVPEIPVVQPKPKSRIEPEPPASEPTPSTNSENTKPASDEPDWETIAKRQMAEMDNFRKRQQRRADEAISAERERLLRLVLPAADNLSRALKQDSTAENSLRQGVELTRREFERILTAEGVTRIETVGNPFNPEWHEALATLPYQGEPNTVVEEIEAGYKLNDKLLRPAKVIVSA